jgi:hypothetical protein
VSSAARDLLTADDLADLPLTQVMVHEAPPDPPQGPIRDALADDAAARVDRAVAAMDAAVSAYNDRLAGVVEARLRGPRARKGTRFWSEQVKSVSGVRVDDSVRTYNRTETKALDGDYILPDRTVDEIADAVRPVGLRIVADAASHVAQSLGRPNVGLAAFDWATVEQAVDSAVQQMLACSRRQAQMVRAVIMEANSTAEDLDHVIDQVLAAVRRGGNWNLMYGRTLATALAGDAALAAAKAMGVTHMQWISRRDDRVRPTHRIADGQERPIGQPYQVGAFRLRFPGDPSVLPEGIGEVAGCRCGLLFAKPLAGIEHATTLADSGTPDAARALLAAPAVGETSNDDPVIGGPSVPAVRVPADVVAYRTLDEMPPVTPGQRISWPRTLTLALASSAAVSTAVLAVSIPAGTVVGLAGGVVVLPAGASLAVASVTEGLIVAMPVMPAEVPAPALVGA